MFSDRGLIMIEVGLNEGVTKDVHPNVPCTPEDVATDVIACAREGAAVVHYHARHADQTNAYDDDGGFYRTVMDAVAAEADVLTYPTYWNCDLTAIWSLDDNPPARTRLTMAPFDIIQEVGVMAWDEANVRFKSLGLTDDASRPVEPKNLVELVRRRISPTVAVFDVGHARWAGLAGRAGLLPAPLNLKYFLCGSWALGPTPRPEALDSYMAEIADGVDVEPTVVPYAMDDREGVEALLDAALDRGLNIRVGLGDNPRAHPGMTNAELVAFAVEKLTARGFKPATADDVRARFDLQA